MPKLPDLVARIRLDTSALDRATGQVKAQTTGMGRHFEKLGATAKLGMAGAGVALAGFAKGALDAAAESQKVTAQTAAVVKSTRGAAGVSVKQIGVLTKRLQDLSGVEDEAIQEGANMLLTFTNIRNEAGKGNDVFNQATGTLLDMSVALGTDAKSSAIQLGKALNDPIKGISALTRVGVSFTAEQKAAIKAMVDVGDTAGAQKIILAELNREFGGSAKAAGDARTPMEKLQLKLKDLQEEIGLKLLPVIVKLADWTVKYVIPFAEKFVEGCGMIIRQLQNVVRFIADNLLGAFEWIVRGAANAFGWVPGLGEKLRAAAKDMEKFRDDVNAALDGVKDKTVAINFDSRVPSAKMPGQAGYIPPLRPGEAGPLAPGQGRQAGPVINNNNITVQKGANENEVARAIAWQGRR